MQNLFLSKIKNKIISFCAIILMVFNDAKLAVSCNRGEGYIDTAIKILLAVVLGALLLAGLYLLFNGTVLPELTKRVTDMFNYNGA